MALIWKRTRISNSLQALPVEGPVQVVHAVAPDEGVDAHRGASWRIVANDFEGEAGLSSAEARGEAEVVVALAEVAEPLEVVDQEVDRREVLGRPGLSAARPRRRCRR